ncbi:MAG: hypothetical protein D6713_09265 [Deltaproteobacteria bacterium]|nr:MAG: hypothetical protein D6713_09265 [Deltaproteobacteria bacterium]
MEATLTAFVKTVRDIFGEELVSVILYGSAADPDEPHPKDLNLLVVAKRVDPEHLKKYRNIAPRFARKGVRNPLFVTEEFLSTSSDVFPMEYADIKRRRRVLHGKDLFEEMEIDPENLRRQVEFEIRGKYLSLIRAYLATFSERHLPVVFNETVSSVLTLARGLLRAAGEEVTGDPERDVKKVEEKWGVSFRVLPKVREVREKKLKVKKPEEFFLDYIEDVETLCGLADRLGEEL